MSHNQLVFKEMVFRIEALKTIGFYIIYGFKKDGEEEEQHEIAAKDALVTYKNHKLAPWTNLTISFMITILKNIIA